MSPTTGSHSFGDLKQLLREAKAGDPGSVEMMLAVCREFLVAIAREELPDVPDRESELQSLVDGAMRQVPAVLAALSESSESELHARLRRAFLDQLHTLSGRPTTHVAGREDGDGSTRGPGSGDTPNRGGSARTPPPGDGPLAPAGQPESSDSGPDPTPQGVQTEPESSSAASGHSGEQLPPGLLELKGFEKVSKVSEGGMGIVYRAWQVRLKRWVALKCLRPEYAEDPDRLQRFRQEAVLAAGLTEPGILQVYDVLEEPGTPILVLPFIDGGDLNKIVAQRRDLLQGKDVPDVHPRARQGDLDYRAWLLPFFDRVLDALVGLHGADVLHRDLKPSNILVDSKGNGLLADFGLARLKRADTTAHKRQVMGTRGYMSPEQWEGDEGIDGRTDVFATGVTIYEALTLKPPYGKSRLTTATPPAELPKEHRQFLPPNLDLVLRKAMHPDRSLRYQTAADLRDDWQSVRKGQLPRKVQVSRKRRVEHYARKMGVVLLVAAVGLAGVGVALRLAPKPAPVPVPEPVAVPEPVSPRTVKITTEPPGARVALVPLDPNEGTPRFEEAIQPADKTPVEVPSVKPGDYLVVAEVRGYGFQEVFRRMPRVGELNPIERGEMGFPHTTFNNHSNPVEIPPITIPKSDVSKNMVLFPGDEFIMGSASLGPSLAKPHRREIGQFYLDKTEVTVAEFRRVRKFIPTDLASHAPKDSEPVRFVTFDQAVRCAEEMGKRLPEEAEYEFAARNGGTTDFPWGNDFEKITAWNYGPVGCAAYDRSAFNPEVCGLFSNVAEWTSSWHTPYPGVARPPGYSPPRNQRVVRGGPWGVVTGGPRPRGPEEREYRTASFRHGVDRDRAYPGLGFRCARSLRPRFPPHAIKQNP